ncbi:hypothetical protein EXIGLDRAFT_783330 [Exidia glandulosa HHB12029]|uniref:Uncharacterized protein n=1 Tax=Exidia glandulosa HHB12029 TaxID=1314781 RepID=A0A166N483_EXIGL|nr:hypothetical protein EXIGLDRAFT_783330 [Exidia glandulosa HHB12029]
MLAAILDTDTGPPILHEDSGFVSPSDTSTFEPTGHSTVIHPKPSPTAQLLPLPTSKPNSSSSSSSRSGPSNRNDPEAAAKRRAKIEQALHESDSAPAPAGENARGGSSPRMQARLAAIEEAMGSETRAPAPAHPQVRPHRPPPTALGGFQFPDGMNASTSQNQPAVKRTADGYHKVAGEMRQPLAPIQLDPSGVAKRARY